MSRPSEYPEDSIFAAALACGDPQDRARFLAEACGDDPSLRARIEDLLRHHAQADRFLESPPPAFAPTLVEPPLREAPGTTIGPYKLLEQIGEGGFGVVFMAEQSAPVKRKVALKVIKPGMDTRQVIARFEAERQALALMDHPHIARVLDGGTTDSGRPYFVMELVKGAPITEFCDSHQLAPRERLELFLTVCHAVQHAHQKGIIHRDIKPSNVLVALQDDQPVVKVIDFGVAKAISGPLTDKTLFTGYSQMIGTPLYMSPEQAALSGVDVDTRTDIYSLGVLLYELLTGTTPFDRSRLKAAAFEEIRRIIREEEPQKPSTRLSDLGSGRLTPDAVSADRASRRAGMPATSLASIAAVRKTEPRRLSQLVKGDLDWIVMKALEKDRTRRYETANSFALDVLRYLHDEPVLACPPSAAYRFGKFARRNKAALATVAMVALTLVAGIIGTTWQAIRATHEADRANKAEGLAQQRYVNERAARVQADAARVAEAQQRGIAQQETARAAAALVEVQEQKQQAEANFVKARRAVDKYLTQVTESELLTVPGLQPLREDLLEAALEFYTQFTQERDYDLSLQQEMAFAHYRLGRIHGELGHLDESRAANQQAIRLFEQLRTQGQQNRDLRLGLGLSYLVGQRYDDAIALCHEVLEGHEGDVEARTLLADVYNALANAADKDHVETALKHHQQAFALREALAREFPDDPRRLAELGATMNNVALLLVGQGKNAEALAMFERAAEYVGQAYERAPHSLLWGEWFWRVLRNVAVRQDALQQQGQALATWQRLVAVSRRRAFENPAIAALRGKLYQAYTYLAKYQQQMGNAREAARSFRDARDVLQNMPRETPAQVYELATVYAVLAQPADETGPTSPEDADEQQRHADLTVATLREAIDAGFANSPAVQSERAFDPLREREDFKELLGSLQTVAEIQRLAGSKAGGAAQNLADRQRAAELLKGLEPGSPGSLAQRATLAATLRSIGEIQTGLKQFAEAEQSLQEAVSLWRELAEAQPTAPQRHVDRIGTQISLGNLYRDSGRGAEAHRAWQACLRELDQLRTQHPDDPQVSTQTDYREYQIAWNYGRLGAFSLAADYSRRSLELQRVYNPVWDLDAGISLALSEGDDALRAICRLIDRERTKADARSWDAGALRNFGKVSNLLNPPALPPEQSLEWIERTAGTNPDEWHRSLLALAQHRAGKSVDALATLEKIIGPGRPVDYDSLQNAGDKVDICFAGALIAHGAGDLELARHRLERSEAIFVHYCRECLQQLTVGLAPPLSGNGQWWELTAPVLLRREAWRLIGDGVVPDEAWLRLIEARAAHFLGDTARRDEQLAAADSRDANVWLARAALADEFDPTGQMAKAGWQRVVELAGNDPAPWLQRGRWYAARGEQPQAEADFAKAFQLDPEHPICRLERARQGRTVHATWDFSQGPAGWQALHDCEVSATDGVLTIHCTGPDPYLDTKGIRAPPGLKVLTICARFRGNLNPQLYWTTPTRPTYKSGGMTSFTLTSSGEEWQEYRVVFNAEDEVQDLRFDPVDFRYDTSVHPPLTLEFAWMLLSDLSAESDWQRVVELAGDDPLPWIQRGRWYAQCGEHEKSDADFARAASLTPNELNKFLEAGWWVVGPYASNLDEFCPPEIDPDPSVPVYVIDPQAGLSEQPVPWRHASAGRLGELRMSDLCNNSAGSAYALTYVYSPVECTRLLRVGDAKGIRIWCNGRLVFRANDPLSTNSMMASRIPVSLRRGRNTILLRAGLDAALTIRVADTPFDQVLTFAEQGLWREAADGTFVNERGASAQPGLDEGYFFSIQVALLCGNDQVLQREGERLLQMALGDPRLWSQVQAASTLVMVENPLLRDHAAKLEAALTAVLPATDRKHYQTQECLQALARCALMLDHADTARTYLLQLQGGSAEAYPMFAPEWALLKEREGQHEEAVAALELGLQAAVAENYQWFWPFFVRHLAHLREAERQLTGSTVRTDEIMADQRKSALADWERRDPSTAAFDHVVTTNARTGNPTGIPADAFLARGGRLAELGRFAEAQTDFNKAVELAPNAPDVLAARGTFHADRGDADNAAADFHAALNQFTDPARPRWQWGVPVDLEAAQRDDVFERLAALRPESDQYHWAVRTALLVRSGDLDGAHAAAQRLTHFGQSPIRAAVALLRGDREEFERLRTQANHGDYPLFQSILLSLEPVEGPLTAELLAAAQRLEEEQPQGSSSGADYYAQFWMAVAKLRTGKEREAAQEVEAMLTEAGWLRPLCWPLLAIAYQKLGEPEAARQWLAKSGLWSRWHSAQTSLDAVRLFGPGKILTHDWLYALVLYREARLLIDGPEALERDDAQRAARQAESRQERSSRAEAALQRGVDLAGNDPMPWIRRGRWYAERGEHAQADADFAQAASLTPHELNKFLEAGWWVVGPYPANLDELCPPEIDPDPSVPVHVVDPQTGPSEQPVAWRSAPAGRLGELRMAELFKDSAASAYALAYVYSTVECTRLVRVGGAKGVRVWCNGRLVFHANEALSANAVMASRVPVSLHRGRNEVLLRATLDASLTIRVADTPVDQVLTFGEQTLWREAADAAFVNGRSVFGEAAQYLEYCTSIQLALVSGDEPVLQREGERLLQTALGDPIRWNQVRAAGTLVLVENPLARDHASELEALLARQLPETSGRRPLNQECLQALVGCAVLLGHTDAARTYLIQLQGGSAEVVSNFAPDWALLEERAGHHEEAVAALELGLQSAVSQFSQWYWPGFVRYLVRLREAERQLTGGTARTDEILADQRKSALADWEGRDPSTAVFDHLVATKGRTGLTGGGPADAYLARALRLAELGRLDEADADFTRAVELAPDDPDVRAARGVFPAVSREAIERTTAAPTPAVDVGAFVLLGGDSVPERNFNTLAAAVFNASDGDTIEVCGNGPFVTPPIKLTRAFTIRAGDGFRPVFVDAAIETDAPLVLEGLELKRIGGNAAPPILRSGSHDLSIANCRFVISVPQTTNLIHTSSRRCVLRNSEFMMRMGGTCDWRPLTAGELVVDNCVHAASFGLHLPRSDAGTSVVRLTRNSVVGIRTIYVFTENLSSENSSELSATVEVTGNIIDSREALLTFGGPNARNAEALVREQVAWQEDWNLYSGPGDLLKAGGRTLISRGDGIDAWKRYWSATDINSLVGEARYSGGDLQLKRSTPESVKAEDFRLLPDSAGYRAGPDGKDLGADIDLVGPGAAYERWKQTPEYQEWLKEIGQVK